MCLDFNSQTRNPLCMNILFYRKHSNKRAASFKLQNPISVQEKLQKLNTASLKRLLQGGTCLKNVALFESVGWLFESYFDVSVVRGIMRHLMLKLNITPERTGHNT